MHRIIKLLTLVLLYQLAALFSTANRAGFLLKIRVSQIFYHIPITCCMIRLTIVIPHQHEAPKIIGFPPVLIS